MEVHFVNQSSDKKLLVIGVFIESGGANLEMKKIFAHLPQAKETLPLTGSLNLKDMLPQKRDFYHYNGSLTTPPCSEIVPWFVMKNSIRTQASQFDAFRKLFPFNARKVHDLNDRNVLETP